jgi:hypothetical protein
MKKKFNELLVKDIEIFMKYCVFQDIEYSELQLIK